MLGLQLGLVMATAKELSLSSYATTTSALNALNAFFLLKKDKVPNEEAVALSPTVGWLLLGCAIAFVLLLIMHAERWRRWWLTVEDPRTMAVYRIVFGFFVICNMNDFFEYWTFLFTDEGIFTADVARQVHASAQFEGFGDGFTEDSPLGFFDNNAILQFLKGPKYSLLYFWDTPKAFWIHMAAFQFCAAMFVIGFRTRMMGILTFFLMNSIFFRNHLFWEGTEVVFRVFLAYLICTKSGHAYSVDNWLRCRKLRKRGLLSERDGPGGGAGSAPDEAHPKGLQAIYRLIPAWPRRLAIFQLGTTYITTGVLKNGGVWAKGDAVYYAWNLDHFYRFYPQRISAIFGTNLLRIASWFSHWGEAFFAVCVLGLFIRWAASEKFAPLSRPRSVVANLCWAALITLTATIIAMTWEIHHHPAVNKAVFVGGWVCGAIGVWALWTYLGRKPLLVKGRIGLWILWAGVIALVDLLLWLLLFPLLNHKQAMQMQWVSTKLDIMAGWTLVAIAIPILVRRFAPRAIERVKKRLGKTRIDQFLEQRHVIDRLWIGRWILGRRIWVTWHLSLMGGIFLLMNIGQFQTGMLSQTLVFLYGGELMVVLFFVARRLKLTRHKKPLPAEDPTLPHLRRDATKLPRGAVLLGAGLILIGILVRFKVKPEWDWRFVWLAAVAFLAGVGFWTWRSSRGKRLETPELVEGGRTAYGPAGTDFTVNQAVTKMPWAYGPLGRFVTSLLLAWHIAAVAVWLLPGKDCLSSFRGEGRKVFRKWLTITQTDQGWGMFAPNPPRQNVFLKVLVTDARGEVYDLNTDVYAPERKPIPWIWNDRMRKMNRRIIGGESGPTAWYRKWYARHVCRKWALDHDGETPRRVELVKVWYRIPSPEDTLRQGYYDSEELLDRTGAEKVEYTERCRTGIMSQLSNKLRDRHGLEPLPDGMRYKRWEKHKKRKWERKQAKARGEEPPVIEKKKKKAKKPKKADKAKKTTAAAVDKAKQD